MNTESNREKQVNTNVEDETLVDDILSKVDFLPPDDELPMIGFSDVTEQSRGGAEFTSLGFAKIHPGWECVGYIVGVGVVESEFDSDVGRRKQRIFNLKGTVRAKLSDADAVADVSGTVKMPQYARLRESLAEVVRAEKRENKKIAVRIKYVGQGPDTMKEDGTKKRSGAHIWDVRRVDVNKQTT